MKPSSLEPLSAFGRALVVGCGRSGVAAAELLAAAGIELHLYDRREAPELPSSLASARCFTGEDPEWAAVFDGIDLLVLSPGVPPGPWRARHAQLSPSAEIHGELSLALLVFASELPTVLITGTNGKSTVTALTGALLEAGGLRPFVGGNLGVPLSERALEIARGGARPGALVIECSSYQLETLRPPPRAPQTSVAMLLNVSPDHLARYTSLADYAATKTRIFKGLGPGSLALLSAADAYTETAIQKVPEGVEVVCVEGEGPPRSREAQLELRDGECYPRASLPLAGRHNASNALFALTAARHLGVSKPACERAMASFSALPHRMNPIAKRDGVVYFDDSKATNVASVLAALEGFERDFVLICGGRAKQGDDPAALQPALARRGRGLVALGESALSFLEMAAGVVPSLRARDMLEAVAMAASMAQPGDAVLLSPACASWDMYRSFAHRGRVFAEAVAALPADTSA